MLSAGCAGLGLAVLPREPPETGLPPLDVLGFALGGSGLTLLNFCFNQGEGKILCFDGYDLIIVTPRRRSGRLDYPIHLFPPYRQHLDSGRLLFVGRKTRSTSSSPPDRIHQASRLGTPGALVGMDVVRDLPVGHSRALDSSAADCSLQILYGCIVSFASAANRLPRVDS